MTNSIELSVEREFQRRNRTGDIQVSEGGIYNLVWGASVLPEHTGYL
jgi:hypothetical protein